MLAFGWQVFTVQRNYGGNWTALFCAGEQLQLPADFAHVYRFKASKGFDGIYYYLMAHDPLMRTEVSRAVEYPGLRYRRILVPAFARVAALGNPEWIAPAFLLVNLIFVFAGTWWSSRFFEYAGAHPAWGLLFLGLPATMVSLDRMTVDLAFSALVIGALVEWRLGGRWRVILLLAMACLARETGVLVVAAFVLHYAFRRRWLDVALVAASAVPFVAWSLYVNSMHAPAFRYWLPDAPFAYTIQVLFGPSRYTFTPLVNMAVRAFDLLALAGVAGAFWWARPGRSCRENPAMLTAALFMFLGVYLFALDEWTHVYDFGRVLSPMLAIVAFRAVAAKRWYALGAVAAVSIRVAVQLAPQLLGA
jgi:hypothetical protein